jgi:hypothetical protein
MKRIMGLLIAATCLLAVPALGLAAEETKPAEGKGDKGKGKGKPADKKPGDKKAEGKDQKKEKEAGW